MLLNNTSQYNTNLVKYIIKFAAGNIEIDNVAINVKNSTFIYAGRAFGSIPYESPWRKNPKARYLIVCRIGKPSHFPFQTTGYRGRKIENGKWPTPLFADWLEAMVYIVAHELMHIQQFRVDARCSEEETERYAMRRLTMWRESKQVPDVPHLKKEIVKPGRDKKAELISKIEHSRKMLKLNQTKLKRAATLAKKWTVRLKRYEKALDKDASTLVE